ncbi:MAG: sugar ABC transporter substrate-binding protein [Thermoleophilia bacterium]
MTDRHPDAPLPALRPSPDRTPLVTRRRLLLSAAAGAGLVVAGPLLAACGGSDESESLAAATGEVDAAGVTLKLAVNQPHRLAFTDVLGPLWEQETGGKLEVTAIPYDQLTSKQVLDAQSGAGEFDLFDYFYFGLGALVDAGALVDLTEWIDSRPDIGTADFLPGIYDNYTLYDGKRWGLPYDGDLHILFYNKELFDRFDLEPPKTWDEYNAAAKTITQGGDGKFYGAVFQGQQVPMILGASYINRLAGYGGELLDSDGNPALTSDAAVEALESLVAVTQWSYPTPLQTGFDQANTAFLSGQGALIDTWTDLSLRAEDPSVSKIQGKWGATTLPVGGANTTPRTALEAGFGIGVSAGSKNREVAARFVEWSTTRANNLKQASTPGAGIDANRTSVLGSSEYAAALPEAIEAIRTSWAGNPLAWPRDANSPKLLQDLTDQLALAIQGEKDARSALQAAQDAWESQT